MLKLGVLAVMWFGFAFSDHSDTELAIVLGGTMAITNLLLAEVLAVFLFGTKNLREISWPTKKT